MRCVLCAAVVGIVTVGCSSDVRKGAEPVHPVSGVITYRGQPVANADVTFHSAERKRSAFGRTNDKGEYRLTTFAPNDGAVEGPQAVTIVKLIVTPDKSPTASVTSTDYVPPGYGPSTQPEKPKSELPERYGVPTTSGLTATIQAQALNKIDFDLEE